MPEGGGAHGKLSLKPRKTLPVLARGVAEVNPKQKFLTEPLKLLQLHRRSS